MPTFKIETNQGSFEIEANREPTADEVQQILSQQNQTPAAPAPVAPPRPPPNALDKFKFSQVAGLAGAGAYGATGPSAALPSAISQPPPGAIESIANGAAALGIRGAPPAIGQAAGSATGPFAPVAVPVLGAIGGVLGEVGAQAFEGKGFRPGAMIGAGVTGAIPGGPLTNAGVKRVALEAGKSATGGVVSKTVETAYDEGRAPTIKELVAAGGLPVAGTIVARAMDKGLNNLTLEEARARLLDIERQTTLAAGKELGLVLPSSVVKESALADLITSIGGPAATVREMLKHNQTLINKAVREELKLPTANRGANGISEREINAAKIVPFKAYDDIKALSPEAEVALQQYKEFNSEVNQLRSAYRASLDPKIKQELNSKLALEKSTFKRIEEEAKKAGKPDLYDKFLKARIELAKIGVVEQARNTGSGDIDGRIFGRALDEGEKYLTGRLETIAKFHNAFPQYVQDVAGKHSPNVNQLTPQMAAAAGVAGDVGPKGVLAHIAAATQAPRAARAFMTSKPYQDFLVNYNYGQTRQDFPAMLARFGGGTAERTIPRDKEDKKKKTKGSDADLLKRADEITDSFIRAATGAKSAPAAQEPPPQPPAPAKTSFIEGKIYRDPNTGERRRYVNGAFQPV